MAKTDEAILLLHVDDILFCGKSDYFHNKFLKACQRKFSTSFNVLGKPGSEISCLKKKIVRLNGIFLIPGTNAGKIVKAF